MIKVACAIIEHHSKVLCAQRSETMALPLKWEFPGGKVEEKERLEDCLKREIKEELRVAIEILEQLPSNRHTYPGNKTVELIPFRCKILSLEIELQEHAQVKWLAAEQLPELDWAEADVPLVKYYIQNY